jgi:hypothetical protein
MEPACCFVLLWRSILYNLSLTDPSGENVCMGLKIQWQERVKSGQVRVAGNVCSKFDYTL